MQFPSAPGVILTGYYPSATSASFMLSDHSRSPLSISNDRYEKSVQLANGYTRKYVIANKRTVNLSWTDLPSSASATIDNGAGAWELKKFYDANYNNVVTVSLYIDQGTGTPPITGLTLSGSYPVLSSMPSSSATTFTAYISDFSFDINKRYQGGSTVAKGMYDLWNVNMSLQEA